MPAEFRPMLASPAELDKVQFPVWASPKLDGIRCIIRSGCAMSRSLKPIPNMFVQSILSKPQLEGLDGELCVGPYNAKDLMQQTSSGVMSVDGTPAFKYYVFDYWNGAGEGFDERINKLNVIFRDLSWAGDAAPHLQLLVQAKITSLDDLNKFEQICLSHGFEGAMIRRLDGAYKQGRSTAREQHLLKIKRFADSEAVIIGFEELMHNENELQTDELGYAKRTSHKDGKVAGGTLGALVVRDCKTGIEFSIGTGFDATLRLSIWLGRASYLGAIVTYKHFENAGVKEAPRFPVFKAFRNSMDL